MKLLTIGASGYVGSLFRQRHNDKFDITDCSADSGFDITDMTAVAVALAENIPDMVINFAALTNTKVGEADRPLYDKVNHLGPQNLVTAASALDLPVLQISTDMIYSGNNPQVLTEDDLPDATDVYGATKRLGEEAVSNYKHGIVARLAYPTSIAPPPRTDLIRKIVASIQTKGQANLFNNQYITPTITEDFVDAVAKLARLALTDNLRGTYNCTGPVFYTPYDLGLLVTQAMGLPSSVIIASDVNEVNKTSEYQFPVSVKLSTQKISTLGIHMRDIKDIIPDVVSTSK